MYGRRSHERRLCVRAVFCILASEARFLSRTSPFQKEAPMDKKEFALAQHEQWHGKIEVVSRAQVENMADLAVAYTPALPNRA